MSFPQLRSRGWNQLTRVQPAGTQYTLSAEAGTYDWTGSAASVLFKRLVDSGVGSYSWTGTDVSFRYGKTLTAVSGSWDWSGVAAALLKAWEINAAEGSYSWTGTDASFNAEDPSLSVNPEWQRNYPRAFHPSHRKPFRQAAQVNLTLSAEEGAFDETGTAADLLHGHEVNALEGSYLWTGTDSFLNYQTSQEHDRTSFGTGLEKYRKAYPRAFHPAHKKPFKFAAAGVYQLPADAATYNWTGTDSSLTYGQNVPNIGRRDKKQHTWPRQFAPSPFGQLRSERNVNSIPGQATRILVGDAGSYSWDGVAASVLTARLLSSAAGSWSWTGSTTTLNKGVTLTAVPGSYTWTGTDISPLYGRVLVAGDGTWAWTGNDASLQSLVRTLVAAEGSWTWTGTAATGLYGHVLSADQYDVDWNIGDVGLIWSAQPGGTAGRMMLLGVG